MTRHTPHVRRRSRRTGTDGSPGAGPVGRHPGAADGPVLRAVGLSRLYGEDENLVRAVDGVDLDVPAGQTLAVTPIVALSTLNTVLLGWSTAVQVRRALTIARTLGATPGQAVSALCVAQLLPALTGVAAGSARRGDGCEPTRAGRSVLRLPAG